MDYNNQWKRKSGTKVALNVCITHEELQQNFLKKSDFNDSAFITNLGLCYPANVKSSQNRPLKQPNADELQGLLWKLYRDIDKEDPVIYGQVKEADDIN
ncbi:uncharacterized protein OCT59_004912 [Rhizophagus irregularis]|uniref:uncharacterized protein n=1 Tax=Rhizophagus irregularis TaxID=588596 RepID=UPI00332FCA96|nr:hypothetical protein OCT59_004912 [Rhizophagus irregularis]